MRPRTQVPVRVARIRPLLLHAVHWLAFAIGCSDGGGSGTGDTATSTATQVGTSSTATDPTTIGAETNNATDATTSTGGTASTDDSAGTSSGSETGPEPEPIDCERVTCRYVRTADELSFDGDGSSWAAAEAEGGAGARRGLPAELARGALYFVADGAYGDYLFDDVESGTESITVKKATAADHGTDVGWEQGFGDGASEWGSVTFARDHYVFDGTFRSETAWDEHQSYGFRLTEILDWPLNFPPGGDDISIRYCDIGEDYSESYVSGGYPSGVYLVKNDDAPGVLTDITVSDCHVHNVSVHVYLLGVENVVVERSYFGPGWGKEAIRGAGEVRDVSIRYNVFRDASQEDPEEAGTTSTAPIAIWGSDLDYRDIRVYGNVFWDTIAEPHSGGVVVVGGDGVGWVGAAAFDTRVYNNTIVGMRNYQSQIVINGGTGNRAYNNLWHDFGDAFTGATGNGLDEGNNLTVDNVFVDYTQGVPVADFRLATGAAAIDAGVAQPAEADETYNRDLYGVVRPQGAAWDAGAFEAGTP